MHTTESYGKMMKNKLYTSCAFTGHRPAKFPWKYDENDPQCVELKAVLARQIEKLAAAGVTDFFTGMALGVDTWAAMAVLDLQERNEVYCLSPAGKRHPAETLYVPGWVDVHCICLLRYTSLFGCQRQFENVRKRRRNFVIFRRVGG